MKNWHDEDFGIDEEEFVGTNNDLISSETFSHRDKRRQLELMLEERKLREDLDDYY